MENIRVDAEGRRWFNEWMTGDLIDMKKKSRGIVGCSFPGSLSVMVLHQIIVIGSAAHIKTNLFSFCKYHLNFFRSGVTTSYERR
jgi:hypothetical protein